MYGSLIIIFSETKMFEATIKEGIIWKKLIEALKDLLKQCTWDCDESGIRLQAMDDSHVSLVSVFLRSIAFDEYRCDKVVSLGKFYSHIKPE